MAKKSKKEKNKGKKLTLRDFAAQYKEENGKNPIKAYKYLFDKIRSSLEDGELNPGDKVSLPLGTLAVVMKKPRKARNPHTGESLQVPERKAVKFKMSGPYRVWGKVKPVKTGKKSSKKSED